jgi:hypothetical protein
MKKAIDAIFKELGLTFDPDEVDDFMAREAAKPPHPRLAQVKERHLTKEDRNRIPASSEFDLPDIKIPHEVKRAIKDASGKTDIARATTMGRSRKMKKQ